MNNPLKEPIGYIFRHPAIETNHWYYSHGKYPALDSVIAWVVKPVYDEVLSAHPDAIDCGIHQKPDGRWGCRECDRSWDDKPSSCARDEFDASFARDCARDGETTKSVEVPGVNAIDPANIPKQPVSGAPSSPAGHVRPSESHGCQTPGACSCTADRVGDVTVEDDLEQVINSTLLGAGKQIIRAIMPAFTVGRR